MTSEHPERRSAPAALPADLQELGSCRRQAAKGALESALGSIRSYEVISPRIVHLEAERGAAVWKLARSRRAFDQEVRCYTQWFLGGEGWRLPKLLDAGVGDSISMLLEYCPAPTVDELCAEDRVSAFEDAGRALKEIHQQEIPEGIRRDDVDLANALALRARQTQEDLSVLGLEEAETAMIAGIFSDWSAWRGRRRILCHGDFEPRNWLRPGPGELIIIDFEHARLDDAAWDWLRLREDDFGEDPRLKTAFARGYGGEPEGLDARDLRRLDLLHALRTLIWAHRHQESEFVSRGNRQLKRLLDEDAEAGFG